MTISVDWPTKVISVEQSDLTLVTGTLYALDTDVLRTTLRDLEDDPAGGISFPPTHEHVTETTIAGITYARFFRIINGYTVEFEDLQYAVRLDNSNNNVFDEGIIVRNQVSVIAGNSAGLIRSSDENAELLRKVFLNRAVTAEDTPTAGKKQITFYDDDQTTPLSPVLEISADGLERTNA